MFCRTKKVKEMIDELKGEIKELKEGVKEAKKAPMISYGEEVVPKYRIWSMHRYYVQEQMPMEGVVHKILAHLGMELVKEDEQPAQVLLKKKPKVKKPL